MKNNQWICGVLNGAQWLVALTQVNDVLEVISTIFAIISTVIIVVFKCINWWDKAKQDKKIDNVEIQELEEIISEAIKEKQFSAPPPEVEVEIVPVDKEEKK